VTCWEILTFGQSPYQGIAQTELRRHLEKGNRLEQPNNCQLELYQTLVQCWMRDPSARPSFLSLSAIFESYLRAPTRFIVDRRRLPKVSDSICDASDQRQLTCELLNDNSDTMALDYFDEAGTSSAASSAPDTPTSRAAPVKLLPRSERRLPSTTSTRYHSDPVVNTTMSNGKTSVDSMAMDEGNYLVPSARIAADAGHHTTVVYTSVVRENGTSELVKSTDQYYNQLHDRRKAVENGEYMAEEAETSL